VTQPVTGVGDHDHNWGNVGLMKIIHDWYWARGRAGPYSVIASFITAVKKFDHHTIPVFMLARDGQIVADDASRVRFETDGVYTDDVTGEPVASVTPHLRRTAAAISWRGQVELCRVCSSRGCSVGAAGSSRPAFPRS